jgi:hypothetical protein
VRRVAAATALAPAGGALALATATPASAQTPPQGVELRTQWEVNHSTCDIHWDGGASVPLPGSPGRSLWLFGDYTVNGASGCAFSSKGTHAGVSNNTAGQVPVVGTIPTPGLNGVPGSPIGTTLDGTNRPNRFLPNPTGLVEPEDGTTPCATPASWYSGASVGPDEDMTLHNGGTTVDVHGSDLVFITYAEVCVQGGFGGPTERVSMAAWDPSINSFVARWTIWDGLTDGVSGVDAQHLPVGSPHFVPGAGMIFFDGTCQNLTAPAPPDPGRDCLAGKVVMVGVGMDDLHDPAGYKYFTGTGSGWTTNYANATLMHPLTTSGQGAYSSVVGDFTGVGENLLMFDATTGYDGLYQVWQSTTPWTGWTLVKSGTMPNAVCDTTPGPGLGCYAWSAHPEISTSSNIMFSVYDPNDAEVEVSSIGSV